MPPKNLRCAVKNCAGSGKIYRFPEYYKEKWCRILKLCPEELKDTERVCQLHFDDALICKKRLKKGALPTRMLGQNCDPKFLNEAIKENEELLTMSMEPYHLEPSIRIQQKKLIEQPIRIQQKKLIEQPIRIQQKKLIGQPIRIQQKKLKEQPKAFQQKLPEILQEEEEIRAKQRRLNALEREERRRQRRITDLLEQLETLPIEGFKMSKKEEQRYKELVRQRRQKVTTELRKLGVTEVMDKIPADVPPEDD